MVTRVSTVKLAIGLGVLVGGVTQGLPALANGASALQDLNGQQSADPFSSRGDNTSNVMQMIHRVMRGDGNVDLKELRAAQRENLTEATSDFFAKQRQRLQTPPGTGTPAPAQNPLSIGPGLPVLLTPAPVGSGSLPAVAAPVLPADPASPIAAPATVTP